MLNALVLADLATEDVALPGIPGSPAQCVLADADRLDSDQDTLRVQAVQDVGEAPAFLANQVFVGNE